MSATVLSDVNFRVYIGPYHLHYDWSVHDYGAAFSGDLYTSAGTTGQVSGASTLVIGSSTGFGTVGGVWAGPNGSGESWEYERFTARSGTTLTVTRESSTDREHNGVHSSGAHVYQFYPVTTNDGQLSITEEADENAATVIWRATISGVRAPQHVLRNGHIVIVTTSNDGGSYTIALVGFVDNPTMSDAYENNAEWNLNIVSSAQLVGEVEARGVRVGEADLADAGSASSVTELVLPYNERASGDFTQASPDLSAAATIDDDLSTLFISEHFTGTDIWSPAPNGDPENDGNLAFAHIYINPPPAAGSGARFIELRVRYSMNAVGYALNSANGGTGCEIWIFNGPGEVPEGGSIFLVEDEDVFSRLNPLAESAAIYENRAFFSHIQTDGGEFWLRVGEANLWLSRVRWGDGNGTVVHEDAPDNPWVGTTVTAPTTGQTMRYIWTHSTGDASAYWNTSMVCHAGYNIDNDDPMWVMVTLPGMGLTLAQDITASVPGNSGMLYINGADEKYSTDGLPSSGTLFVGDEQISYASKTPEYVTLASSGARGAGGTTAAIHNAGDEVFIMDGSVPTDAFLIDNIGWQRAGGTIYPKHFTLWRSNIVENVRTPDQDDYTTDWSGVVTLTTNTDPSHTAYGINARVRHLLYEIFSMTTDPARVRINEINAVVDSSLHDPDLWLAADTSAGDLIQQVLENAGIWPGAISHTGTPAIAEAVTADDNAWTVVADLAEYSGCRVTVEPDSKFTIAVDNFWTGTPTVTTTWNRTSAVSVQQAFRKVNPVSQVILPWKTPDGTTSGKIYWPESPERGTKLEKPETLYASSGAATNAARRLYYMRLYPFEAMVTAADEVNTLRPGEAHQVVWQFADDMQAMDRLYVVMSAEHKLSNGNWSSTFRLVQYGHESNF